MFRIKVPATTANMGPGYDVLGMALTLYNEFEVESKGSGIETVGFGDIPLEENLVYTTMKKVLNIYEHEVEGLRITAKKIDIPISRGLGSSATCIVAGIMIANELMNNILNTDDLIKIGTYIEGHPDNIVPAVVGGMTVSIYEEGVVTYSNINVSKNLRFVAITPDFTMSTNEARKVVPKSYDKSDCIFNISRVAMLVAAMNNGETQKLRIATQDKIHQPYRATLIPDIDNIFKYAKKLGSKAEIISGSGSTLMAIIDKDNIDFEKNIKQYLDGLKDNWTTRVLEVDTQGAKVL